MKTRKNPDQTRRHIEKLTRACGGPAGLERLEDRTLLTAYAVTNNLDSGAGSLRDAIDQANATPGADTIIFDVTGSTKITLASPLQVSDAVTIDGTTQAGYAGAPVVVIKGTSSFDGLRVEAGGGGSTVRGLAVVGFSRGIVLAGNGNTLEASYVGLDPTLPTRAAGQNVVGILVQGSDNLIGGTAAGAGNVVVYNRDAGVVVDGGSGNRIQGNLVGVNAQGADMGNAGTGVVVDAAARLTTVGGDAAGAGNVIAQNQFDGIDVLGAADVVIAGNRVGLNAAGAAAGNDTYGVYVAGAGIVVRDNVISANAASGVALDGTAGVTVTGNRIGTGVGGLAGGELPGNDGNGILILHDSTGNLIADNQVAASLGDGVHIDHSSNNTLRGNEITGNFNSGIYVLLGQGNTVDGNSVHHNAARGIDLIELDEFGGEVYGPTAGAAAAATYGYQTYPTIGSVVGRTSGTVIGGTLDGVVAGRTYVIRLYANADFEADFWGDGSVQYGEGEHYLGSVAVTAQASGTLSFERFVAGVPSGQWFTATATDDLGNTSEFSVAFQGDGTTVPDPVISTTLTSDVNPSVFGQSVTFTAHVLFDGHAPAGGDVRFTDGGTLLFEAAVDANGDATFTTSSLSVGVHSLNAYYFEVEGAIAAESNPLIQNVNAADAPFVASGHTLRDTTGNGVSADDTPLAGVTVRVFKDSNDNGKLDPNDALVAAPVTDGAGLFELSVTVDGRYFAQEVTPGGYVQTGPASGYYTFVANVNDSATSLDFANWRRCASGLSAGTTATIGFWHNKNGQSLIKSFNGGASSKKLAGWLAGTLPNLYGAGSPNGLVGKTNADVAALFLKLFKAGGQKLDAQVLGVALAVYGTTSSLGGTAAVRYGFTVDGVGTGHRLYNVGSNGAAFGVANGTSMEVIGVLAAADARAVNGVLYNGNTALRNMANVVFGGINERGDI